MSSNAATVTSIISLLLVAGTYHPKNPPRGENSSVDGEGVLAQDPARRLLDLPVREQLRQHLGERVAPPRRCEQVQLRRARSVGGVEQLRHRGELERLAHRRRR